MVIVDTVKVDSIYLLWKFYILYVIDVVVAQGTSVSKATAVSSFPIRGNGLLYINIFIYSLWYQGKSAALSSALRNALPRKFGGKWGTECLNTRFPLPTLLCAGYSVKLIILY